MSKHDDLILKYNSNELTNDEQMELEQLIEQGAIELSELDDVENIHKMMPYIEIEKVNKSMDVNFYSMLADEKLKSIPWQPSQSFSIWWSSIWQSKFQWGYSFVLVLIGLGTGLFWQPSGSSDNEVLQLTTEVQQMKEMMLLNMLDKSATTDRLMAVSLTSGMDTVSNKVASALIDVLRNDDNTNVRLAAINALAQYTNNFNIREDLIFSIKFQDSPLVQLALAELMVMMKEKKAVKEFEVIIENENTPKEVIRELQSAMQTLI